MIINERSLHEYAHLNFLIDRWFMNIQLVVHHFSHHENLINFSS
jgi:hypothetical protein